MAEFAVFDSRRLRGKPWNGDPSVPANLAYPQGMLGPEERRCLYYLTASHYSGAGRIVDAGAFLGASAFALAAGLAASKHSHGKHARVVSYDYFCAVDDYVAAFVLQHFRPIHPGESFLDIFEYQTALWRDYITVVPGNFLSARWDGAPIEVLFVDIAKTVELNGHVISQFFPHLVPGRTVLIHQDYLHCWHPYIQITMEFLDEYFLLVDPLVSFQSRVWLSRSEVPQEKLERAAAFEFSEAERATLLGRAIERSTSASRWMLMVTRLYDAYLVNDLERCQGYIAELDVLRERAEDGIWWTQYDQVREKITGGRFVGRAATMQNPGK